jgi:hypothetical protein
LPSTSIFQPAQAAFLVAAEHQRRAAVRAHFIEHADATFRVAEHDEIFAEQTHLERIAIGLGDFFDQAGGKPVASDDLAHRRIAFDAAQQIVFLVCQHRFLRRAPRRLILSSLSFSQHSRPGGRWEGPCGGILSPLSMV